MAASDVAEAGINCALIGWLAPRDAIGTGQSLMLLRSGFKEEQNIQFIYQ